MKVGDPVPLTYELLSSNPPEVNGLDRSVPPISSSPTESTSRCLLLNASAAPYGQQRHIFSDPDTAYKFNESSGGALLAMQNDARNANFPFGSRLWRF